MICSGSCGLYNSSLESISYLTSSSRARLVLALSFPISIFSISSSVVLYPSRSALACLLPPSQFPRSLGIYTSDRSTFLVCLFHSSSCRYLSPSLFGSHSPSTPIIRSLRLVFCHAAVFSVAPSKVLLLPLSQSYSLLSPLFHCLPAHRRSSFAFLIPSG